MAYTKDEVQNLTKEAIALGLTTDKLLENIGSNFTKLFDAVDFLAENSEEAGVAGSQLEVSVDSKTYVMAIKLKNTAGTVLSEKTIDLPIETMVVDASYANGKLTLKLQNGTTLSDIDISSLISGLVPETRKINGKDLSNDITLTQDNVGEGTTYTRFSKTDKSNLDKNTTARHTHDNRSVLDATTASFTTEEKTKLAGIESNAQNYVLPTANGTRLGGVKTGGDVEVNDGVVTVLTVGGKSADEIGKVKDVTVNGLSVLGDDGTAALTIKDISSAFTDVTANASKAINGTTYYGFNITNATDDISIEVYNSSGQQIVVQKVRDTTNNTIFVACSTASGGTYSVRSLSGNSVGGGVSKAMLQAIAEVSSPVSGSGTVNIKYRGTTLTADGAYAVESEPVTVYAPEYFVFESMNATVSSATGGTVTATVAIAEDGKSASLAVAGYTTIADTGEISRMAVVNYTYKKALSFD